MAQPIQPVQPGDIITASLMNQLLQALAALDGRVTKLESGVGSTGSKPRIQDFSPKLNLHEGDTLTMTGQNLWAAGMNSVSVLVGSAVTPVITFISQSDSLLVFKIPGVFAQPGGTPVSVQVVSPTQGSDSISFTLLPAVISVPTGDIRVQLSTPPNTVFNAPGTYALNYTLNANTTLGDTYDLKTSVSGAGWVLTSDVPSLVIEAAPSLTQPTIKKGSLQLTIPNGAVGSSNLSLEVKSRLNPTGLDKFSPTAVIPVGGQVLLSSGIGIVAKPGVGDLDGSGNLLVPATPAGLTINFLVTVTTAPKDYLLAYRFDNDAANWQAPTPPNSTKVTINQSNLGTPISVVVRVAAGAQPSNLYLKVTQSDDPTVVTEVFFPVKVK
ncbi:MAG TPA: IPT/TIG domain-containing protein [Candidatus Angelobacter sp.]|nr:IPT/TIG domain-containing protein [Candidatus Angelobacter sp.]